MHKRQAIREAVVAAIQASPALSGRVFASRERKTNPADLPCVLVYTIQEQRQEEALGRTLYRRLSLLIEIRTKATGELDDKVDDLCAAVETAMGADPRFGVVASDSAYVSTQIGFNGEGIDRYGVAALAYDIGYVTRPGDPSA